MVRFSNIALAYFLIGAVMWGGGAIAWSDAGIGQLIIDEPAPGGVNERTSQELEQSGGPIQNALGDVGAGGLIAVWNLVAKFIGFMFWPMTTLQSHGVPARVWVPLGGMPTMAFYGGFIRLIRTSG